MRSRSRPPALRALYICYLSLGDPLVHTQVIAYLAGIAERGHVIHLLTFDAHLSRERRRFWKGALAERGISWHSLRYHKRPSLPATVYDALAGALYGSWLVRRYRLDAVHARNHVPAATALIVRRLTGCRLLFDMRGLMAEEYVAAGGWPQGGLAFWLTKAIERAAIRRCDGMVMLTERVRRSLFGAKGSDSVVVIPCCADLERLEAQGADRDATRAALGIEGRAVLVYVGKLTGRYLDREMVEFFSVARELQPNLLFLVLTQGDADAIAAEFARAGISDSDYSVLRAEPEEVGRYLAAADYAVAFVRQRFPEIAASPTKIGEYLGAGLPVVSTADVGDVDSLLRRYRTGVLIDDFSRGGYEAAARQVLELAADGDCPGRCRSAAREQLSLAEVGIPRYDRLYRHLATRAVGSPSAAPAA